MHAGCMMIAVMRSSETCRSENSRVKGLKALFVLGGPVQQRRSLQLREEQFVRSTFWCGTYD